jgi:hypothetical protein
MDVQVALLYPGAHSFRNMPRSGINRSYDSSIFSCFFIIHLFTCACVVWVISPPAPHPHPLPDNTPRFQAEHILPLSLILLKRRHKHNKEDKAFLLVQLRIAIQGDS